MGKKTKIEDAYLFFQEENDEFKEQMKMETLLVDIACEFIKYRNKHNMTQKDLAEKLEISQAMVSKLESGEYNPTLKMLCEIAQKLSLDFELVFNNSRIQYNYSELFPVIEVGASTKY